MVKKIVGLLLMAFFAHKGNALFGMEGQLPEIAELGLGMRPDFAHDMRYSLSLHQQNFDEAIEAEARRICEEEYLNGEELADQMLALNRFNLPMLMVFVEYGADLNYALRKVLNNNQLNPQMLRIWVLFCLIRGAQVPEEYKNFIRKILGNRLNDISSAIINGENYSALQHEIEELFLYAAGQGELRLLQEILTKHRSLISLETMREAFINASYANHTDILRLIYRYNKIEDTAWSETLSYALLSASVRQHANAFNLILLRASNLMQEVDLSNVILHIKNILSLKELPETLKVNYQKMLRILSRASDLSSKAKTIETLVLSSPLVVRFAQDNPGGQHRVTQMTINVEQLREAGDAPGGENAEDARVRHRAQTELPPQEQEEQAADARTVPSEDERLEATPPRRRRTRSDASRQRGNIRNIGRGFLRRIFPKSNQGN